MQRLSVFIFLFFTFLKDWFFKAPLMPALSCLDHFDLPSYGEELGKKIRTDVDVSQEGIR